MVLPIPWADLISVVLEENIILMMVIIKEIVGLKIKAVTTHSRLGRGIIWALR